MTARWRRLGRHYGFVIEFRRPDAPPPVTATGVRASGIEQFSAPGPVYLDIASTCPWRVKVLG